MKKNKIIIAALVLSTAFYSCGNETAHTEEETTTPETTTEEVVEVEAEKKSINVETSTINWEGTMVGVYNHTGTVSFNSGEVEMAGGALTGGSFEVNMSSITTTDENYDEAAGHTPDKLVGHLSSPDFFDVENNPTASFVISSVEGDVATGTLTVRGKSNEEKVEGVVIGEDGSVSGTLTFDRKKYDVVYDNPAKEMVLSDDVSLTIELKM